MSIDKLTFSKNIYTGIAILLIVIMAMLMFEIEDKLQICLLLLTISLAVMHPLPFRQWTLIDISLSLITVYDIVSCLYAGCSVPAIHSTLLSIFCLTSYFVLRNGTSDITLHPFCPVYGICDAICVGLPLSFYTIKINHTSNNV